MLRGIRPDYTGNISAAQYCGKPRQCWFQAGLDGLIAALRQFFKLARSGLVSSNGATVLSEH
jgi:hypothetical protein